ncbi:MAG: glutamine synthetase, partial [Planctomycetaceae bacterium]|nr:glutamine synthetase [Planctomycetaceae bacterium]
MAAVTGMLNREQLAEMVADGRVDTVLTVCTDLYGRFVGKRFDAAFYLEQIAADGTHACDYLFTVDMEMEPVSGYRFANWESGYGDVHLVPDEATMRIADWLERTALVICDVQTQSGHQPVAIAPRSMLQRQIDHLTGHGFAANAGSELEYYLFNDSYRDAAKKNYTDLESAGWYIEDYHAL